MELRQIQYFIQLYKDRNITQASKNLYISQQGLSKSVSRLEEELGFSLFDRHTTGVIPTREADTLFLHFDRIFRSYHDLLLAIDTIRQNRVLTIMAYPGFSLSCSHTLLSDYRALHPDSNIRYLEDNGREISEQLHCRRADLAILRTPLPDKVSSVRLLYREPLFLVLDKNHPLASDARTISRDGAHLKDLDGQKLLLLNSMEGHALAILKYAAQQGISCPVQDTVSSSEFLLTLCGSSLIGFGSRRMYRHHSFPDILFLPFAPEEYERYPELTIETHLAIPSDTVPDEATQQLIDYILSVYTE